MKSAMIITFVFAIYICYFDIGDAVRRGPTIGGMKNRKNMTEKHVRELRTALKDSINKMNKELNTTIGRLEKHRDTKIRSISDGIKKSAERKRTPSENAEA